MKRGPKLNLIKKNWGKRMGGGGVTLQLLTVRALKPKQYARLCQMRQIQKCNYLYNVEHVVQSTFQNTLISF